MGCGASSQADPPESTGHRGGTNTYPNSNTNNAVNTNTNTNTNDALNPDDNAIYGYDLYEDDHKKQGGSAGGAGLNTNEMQYDDKGYYGETDNEKKEVELFPEPGQKKDDRRPEHDPEPPVQPIEGGEEDYTSTDTGLRIQFTDFRCSADDDESDQYPDVAAGEVYEDREFQLCHAITDTRTTDNLEWKRPSQLVDTPLLFSEGTTRYDIGQGSAGTCWFLSTIANISENPALLKQVIPPEEYPSDGVFHARFWRFGKWEDVYIDDFLPIIHGSMPWGARSATDDNEFWVSLLEKAFARYHGSYNALYGGQPGDAYLALTGGVAERIAFEESDDKPKKLFKRMKNAINSGAHLTCVVPDEHNGKHGLIGGHAYSLTGTAQVKGVCLVRVRNPWGKTEWTGDWSDESPMWNGVSESEVKRAVIDDGEFWICLEDFMTFFSQITICSLTPDFDMDGSIDCLNYVTNIYGEWRGETAAGFKKKLDNPRFLFTVPESESRAAVVVQLIQKMVNRQNEKFQIRCDLYRVLYMFGESTLLELMGENTNSYCPETQCAIRFSLAPGTYAVVPSTVDPGMEKQFLIRVFSSCPVSRIRELPRSHMLCSDKEETFLDHDEEKYPLNHCVTKPGAWTGGENGNSGGQISHADSHASNPQFLLTVHEPTPVVLHVVQQQEGKMMPVGFRLFPTDEIPLDYRRICDLYDDAMPDIKGNQSQFVLSYDVDASYMLQPGQYNLLVHMDKPGTEKEFFLIAKSTHKVDIRGYQTGMRPTYDEW